MRAGQLTARIAIEEPVELRSETTGAVETTWAPFATCAADVSEISGQERFASDQRWASASHEVRLRYLAGVTAKMRVNWGGRVLNIQSVTNPDGRHIATLLACEEIR